MMMMLIMDIIDEDIQFHSKYKLLNTLLMIMGGGDDDDDDGDDDGYE